MKKRIAIIGTEGSGKTVLATTLAHHLSESTGDVFLSPQGMDTAMYVETGWDALCKGEWLPSTPPGQQFALQWNLHFRDDAYPVKLIDSAGQDLRQLFSYGTYQKPDLAAQHRNLLDYIKESSAIVIVVNLGLFIGEADYIKRKENELILKEVTDMFAADGKHQDIAFVFTAWDQYQETVEQKYGSFRVYMAKELPLLHNAIKLGIRSGDSISFFPVAAVADTEIKNSRRVPCPGFRSVGIDTLTDWLIKSIQGLKQMPDRTAKIPAYTNNAPEYGTTNWWNVASITIVLVVAGIFVGWSYSSMPVLQERKALKEQEWQEEREWQEEESEQAALAPTDSEIEPKIAAAPVVVVSDSSQNKIADNWVPDFVQQPVPEAQPEQIPPPITPTRLFVPIPQPEQELAATQNDDGQVEWLRENANANEQYELGCCYIHGADVPQDYTEAVRWFRKSAEQGNANAQYELGCCYTYGAGVPQDYTEAVRWLRKSAEQGNVEAQYGLGWFYYTGKGVPQDYTEAVGWCRKSAEQGNANAQYNLACFHYTGEGVPQDYTEAVRWLRRSAEQGNVEAQYGLGWFYYTGKGVPQDYTEAVGWCRKSAEQGNANAQYNLACFHYTGEGVPQNYTEAVRWLRRSAEQGNAEAQKALYNLQTEKLGLGEKLRRLLPWKSAGKVNPCSPSF
ncbi:hypothetical protein FACS189454_07260 [Planctomycetales bacterium]|nr:hypothetical protein FACS189454_07260 [Planctomycetales bacterium]